MAAAFVDWVRCYDGPLGRSDVESGRREEYPVCGSVTYDC